MEARQTENEQAQFWSSVAERYDRVVDLRIGGRTRSMVRERVDREGNLGRVMELGCGAALYRLDAASNMMDGTSTMKDAAPDLNQRIAGRVRELRAARGLSLDALAGRSGVSRSMISLIERGESSPTAVVLEKLAAGLGVTLASLFDAPAAAAPARVGPLARRAGPAGVARPGLGLPPAQRLAAGRAAADADRRGALPAGRARGVRERRARPARAPAGVGARGRDRRHAWARSATDCARGTAWPCSSTARRCSTIPRESPRATPW